MIVLTCLINFTKLLSNQRIKKLLINNFSLQKYEYVIEYTRLTQMEHIKVSNIYLHVYIYIYILNWHQFTIQKFT